MFLMITDGIGQAERQALRIEPAPKPGPSDWILGLIYLAYKFVRDFLGLEPAEEENEAETRDGI